MNISSVTFTTTAATREPTTGAPEDRLNLFVRQISTSEGIPPFAQHARELMSRSLKPDGSSSHLAHIILKDVGLTSQVMRVANSSMYNRSGRAINSVTHAITLLGWETVRNLVGAMRFVEQFAKHSAGLRELMMFSLLTATHSRHIAAVLRYPRPEEAYVCGLFRNMGEVLTARYFSEEYAKVVVAMLEEKLPERVAGLRVLEFEMDSLARCLAAFWNMPAAIRTCLSGADAPAETIEERVLASAANYGHVLTSGLYRYGRFEPERMNALVDCTGRKYLLPYADLKRIIQAAADDTKHTFQALQIPLAALHLDKQAEHAREVLAYAVGSRTAVEFGANSTRRSRRPNRSWRRRAST